MLTFWNTYYELCNIMILDYCPVTVHQFDKGDFPADHTSVLKVGQVNGYQLYTSTDEHIAELTTLFLSIKSVTYVEISSIELYGDPYMSLTVTRNILKKLSNKLVNKS